MGTSLPMAIVESCSMYHDGNIVSDFDAWWTRHDSKYAQYTINELDFQDFIFPNGLNKGDILLIIRAKPEKLKIGDVIIFDAGKKNPLIHRIINIKNENSSYTFSTIGDNNDGQLPQEKTITEDQLVGKAIGRIAPSLGWGKLVFFEASRPASERGFCEEN